MNEEKLMNINENKDEKAITIHSEDVMKEYLFQDEKLIQLYSSLTEKEKKVVYYAIVVNSNQYQEEIGEMVGLEQNTISYYLKKPKISQLVNTIKLQQLKMVRDEIVNNTAQLTNFALSELKILIEESEGKDKVAAIKLALEYDTNNKINTKRNDTALNSTLV